MANEIKYGWKTGETLTAEVYKADTTLRETAISLTETGTSGMYFGTPAALVAGDSVIVDDGTRKIGWGEYRTEVDCVLIEGADFTDTLIGADGDTLETLSDQMDDLSAEASKVLNEYGQGE